MSVSMSLYNFYSMKKNFSSSTLPNASWAHKHGISKENNGSAMFGLNPNLNIEDEYIENLLKQVHFMNMEIKLLKEKQQQSDGNSMWGIVNRVNEPHVKNIVDSNQKYQHMKKQVDGDVNKTEYENMKLADQQNAVIRKMNYLEERIDCLKKSKGEAEAVAKEKEGRIGDKIGEYQNKLRNVLAEKERESKKLQQFSDQLESTTYDVEKQDFQNTHERNRIENDEKIEQIILADRRNQIALINSEIKRITQSIEGNQEYQRAREDQDMIKDKMACISKDIANADFNLLQVTQSIKLAQTEKEKEVLERKRYMEEYESLKVILMEIRVLNQARISQETLIRMRQSNDIQKGEYQTGKLQKSLDEIKKKLIRSEQSQKALKQEVEHSQRQLLKLKTKRQSIMAILTKMVTQNDKQDTMLTGFKNQFRKMDDQFQKMVHADFTSNCELNDIESEIMFLRERKEYLSEVLNLKETLNQTKLDELQKVVQKNRDVNETVGTLMDKWEEIRQFSKM